MGVPLDGGEKWRAEEEKREKLESLNKAIEKLDDTAVESHDETFGEQKSDSAEASTEESTNTLSREAGTDQPRDSLDLDAFARSQEDGAFARQLDSWLRFHGLDPEGLDG